MPLPRNASGQQGIILDSLLHATRRRIHWLPASLPLVDNARSVAGPPDECGTFTPPTATAYFLPDITIADMPRSCLTLTPT